MIKDSGDRTEFETGAKRDMHAGKGRMDLLPWYGIMEVSKHCEEGALKYGEHNVDKGIPLHSLLDSAARHLAKYMVGMDDEDHLRAACWNLLWALNQRETHPELDDRFSAKPDQDQESLDKLAVRTRCLKCGDVHKFYKPAWEAVHYLYESDIKIAMCPRCREKTAHFTMVKAEEDKKKNHQVLPFCWISSRLVFRMSALDVAIGFIRSSPNMNIVHNAQYTIAVGSCQGGNKNCFLRSPASTRGRAEGTSTICFKFAFPKMCQIHVKIVTVLASSLIFDEKSLLFSSTCV